MNDDAQIVSGSEEGGNRVLTWDMVEGGAPTAYLEHARGSPAWSADIGEVVAPEECPPVPFIHSLSPHPTGSSLLTAGGDFVWLWNTPEAEEEE